MKDWNVERHCYSILFLSSLKYLFNFLVVNLINTLSLLVEIVENIPWFGNYISVELHDEASPAESVNNHGKVDHEVVEVASGEHLWKLEGLHGVIFQIQLDIKFEGAHVVPEDAVHIRYVVIEQGEHGLLRSKPRNSRCFLKK